MPEKYDLEEMLREIREDEKASVSRKRKLSQEDIVRMLTEKREEE